MMAHQKHREPKLFYHGINLEERLGPDHPLRRVAKAVDFSFVRHEVADCYGVNGNISVDPNIVLKLMFLLFYENVKSERELMRQLPLRLDWLWFCEYDIDDVTPNHSILSKARRRWGAEVFDSFFLRVLEQCIDAGLVDGNIIHIDSSLIQANASKDKLQPELQLLTQQVCQKLEDEPTQSTVEETPLDDVFDDDEPDLNRRVSPTDPEARLAKKYSQTTLGYKDHRAVDDKYGIITSTITTAANINDDKLLTETIENHESNTGSEVKTAVADKAYGVIENYKYLHDRGSKACIPHQKRAHKKDKFPHEAFRYDPHKDCYVCPAGRKLPHVRYVGSSRAHEYRCARETCQTCRFFSDCVMSKKYGRTISRHEDSEYIEWADSCLSSENRRRLLSRRRAKAEGSFADASNNHSFKRCRWRGRTMAAIQNLMIAAVQNLRKLLRYCYRKTAANNCMTTISRCKQLYLSLRRLLQSYHRLFLAKMSKYLLFKEPML